MDGRETVGNSLGRAPWGRSDMEATRSDDRVDGGETVGNSVGRAPLGRSEIEATTGWMDGKPWEIAWGEVCWEGARSKRR